MEHAIAGRMTVRVVDLLEVIDIDEQQRERGATGRRAATPRDLLVERRAIRHTRELVEPRWLLLARDLDTQQIDLAAQRRGRRRFLCLALGDGLAQRRNLGGDRRSHASEIGEPRCGLEARAVVEDPAMVRGGTGADRGQAVGQDLDDVAQLGVALREMLALELGELECVLACLREPSASSAASPPPCNRPARLVSCA